MSKINCEACDNLRENAPEFVQNGVTDNICTSLQNNTGLNPSLSTLHNDAQDMHDVNDCTIGRMAQELEAYDVCDWKKYMGKLVPNIYEHNKAVNCVDAGQWAQIEALNDRAELLCKSIDNIFNLIRGGWPKEHYGSWLQSFLDKITITRGPGSTVVTDKTVYKPSWYADILEGAGCDATKRLGRNALGAGFTVDISPYSYGVTIDTPVSVGEVIGTIPRSAVPDSDYALERWRGVLRYGNHWQFGILNGDTIMYIRNKGYTHYQGVEFNPEFQQYGEDTMVIFVSAFIGPSRTGGLSGSMKNGIDNYNA